MTKIQRLIWTKAQREEAIEADTRRHGLYQYFLVGIDEAGNEHCLCQVYEHTVIEDIDIHPDTVYTKFRIMKSKKRVHSSHIQYNCGYMSDITHPDHGLYGAEV